MDAVTRGVDQVLAEFEDEWSTDKLADYRARLTEAAQQELTSLMAANDHTRMQDISEAITELAVAKLALERAVATIGTVLKLKEETVRVWAGEYGTVPVVDDSGQIAYEATIAALFSIRALEDLAAGTAGEK